MWFNSSLGGALGRKILDGIKQHQSRKAIAGACLPPRQALQVVGITRESLYSASSVFMSHPSHFQAGFPAEAEKGFSSHRSPIQTMPPLPAFSLCQTVSKRPKKTCVLPAVHSRPQSEQAKEQGRERASVLSGFTHVFRPQQELVQGREQMKAFCDP